MKPKTKFQKQIVEASKKLPKITDTQIQWAYRNCIEHIGHKTTKSVITCLECNHAWTDTTIMEHCTCPHCNTKLKIEKTRKRTFLDYEYLCIVTACEGFQVLRFFYIECKMKKGEEPQYFHSEVVQRWVAPNGKYATMARLRPMGFYGHEWSWWSDLEIRPERSLYNITPTEIYPQQKLIPEVQRSGYKKQFYNLTPFDLFSFLLSNSKAETLLKAGQTDLFRYFAYNTRKDINDYWASVRICFRNGYKIEKVSQWCDYIDLLRFFGKDLHNAKYVCPKNLKAEHDKYVKKKKEYYEQERKEEARKKALEDQVVFNEEKSKFFGIQFTDGLIQVRVLESVEEVMLEGDNLHHCIFTNNYHLKPDSLLLTASIDGQPMETIELSISEMKILQCTGVCNQNSKYHKQILNLVGQNIPLIQKRMSA
ncbi:PcfJ domain-containing protein [Dysgonomonas sp. ZJ709]|uniref:PcfJ domain-containing protein n=1 Tax=Dysgonomonas sp. ZJ709 TaxID=2709797 RepID=UPI0013EBFF25|nr:PcfJ domain-containing protein [Dysgonomonas sp. ZJ709]